MGDISQNFNRSEFECECGCGQDTVDVKLIQMVQHLRDKFGPIRINSGNRCVRHNTKVGGVDTSYHIKGRAADIVPLAAEIEEVARYADEVFNHFGLGVYNSFIHIDSRDYNTRWRG